MAPTTPTGSRTTNDVPTSCSHVNPAAIGAMEPKVAMGRPTCTSWESTNGMPTSWVMRSARLSILAPRASLTLVRRAVRSSTGVDAQPGKACRAAATAASMSSMVPSGTEPMTASVVESITSIVPAPVEGTHAPPIQSRSRTSVFVVVIVGPPCRGAPAGPVLRSRLPLYVPPSGGRSPPPAGRRTVPTRRDEARRYCVTLPI